MKYHILAFVTGCIMDLIIGDPYNLPHPVRWIGKLIEILTDRFLITDKTEDNVDKKNLGRGILLCFSVCLITGIITLILVLLAYQLHPIAGIIFEAVLTCYILAARSLKTESMKVYDAVKTDDIVKAREAVSMIVGRDTQTLSMTGVIKAAVETVAENTSDGVIAPLIYTCIGGPFLGMLYKAVNTMDSMVGYHNERYEFFGRCAARTDDLLNYLPSRISALIMIFSSGVAGREFDSGRAYRIFVRDRFNHKSPNSAQTESALAGALGIRLAGDASYFGQLVKKPYIGDEIRQIEAEDIIRANKLMYITELVTLIMCLLIMGMITYVTWW